MPRNSSGSQQSESSSRPAQCSLENLPSLPPKLAGDPDNTSSEIANAIITEAIEKAVSYTCPVKDCGKNFDRHYSLRVHFRKHSGEEPYLCEICSKTFRWRSSASHHRRTCHAGEPKGPIVARRPKSSDSDGIESSTRTESIISESRASSSKDEIPSLHRGFRDEISSLPVSFEDEEDEIMMLLNQRGNPDEDVPECKKLELPESPMSCEAFAAFLDNEANNGDNLSFPQRLTLQKLFPPIDIKGMDKKEVIDILKACDVFDGIDFCKLEAELDTFQFTSEAKS